MNRRLVSLVFLLFIAWSVWQYVVLILFAATLIVIFRTIIRFIHWLYIKRVNLVLKPIDEMSGEEFEIFVAQTLRKRGYTRVKLTQTYDYGVDILARKDGIRWGIQVKRNSGQTKAEAVRQAVTGLKLYNCDKAMVISSNYFSRYAVVLAKANNCALVDRTALFKLLN